MHRARTPARIELHTHLGSSVDPAILWSIAHAQGIRLPTKDYWAFEDMITMRGSERNKSLDDMHDNFFRWTELIQSSPLAVEESVKSVIGGGYRKCNIVLQELRFNPMFRNRGGEQDLDHIIMAALRGMDKALLEYPQVRAGLILMMDRTLPFAQNEIILEKALFYRTRGVVGIDLGGPQRSSFSMKRHAPLFARARAAGLGVTIHTGEEGTLDELRYVVRKIRPDRIGHGLLAVQDPVLLAELAQARITLELCPTSNIRNRRVRSLRALGSIIARFQRAGVRFTINTDGPEMYQTHVQLEEDMLVAARILRERDIATCRTHAFEAAFVAG